MAHSPTDEVTIDHLLEIMARLRDPVGGCPWDLQQDARSLAPYALEEAYEVVEAIEQGDMQALRCELGDLLFQVVFHARLAAESGWFDFADVVQAVCDKMTRRHPHVFAGEQVADVREQSLAWERHKRLERAGQESLLDDVPRTMTALTRADKLQKRAAQAGFDWPAIDGPLASLREELEELERAVAGCADSADIKEEAGDLLFAAVNVLRHAGIDPESALRQGNRKFERRIRAVERKCRAAGMEPDAADPAMLDACWRAVKQEESGTNPDR